MAHHGRHGCLWRVAARVGRGHGRLAAAAIEQCCAERERDENAGDGEGGHRGGGGSVTQPAMGDLTAREMVVTREG